MRRRILPARGTVEQELAYTVQIWPPNCIVPLQIAKVQVSTKYLDVSGMESKATNQRQLCLCLCLRNSPAITPQLQGHLLRQCCHCCDGLS